MFSNKMDFSSCVIWIDFYKSGHICRITLFMAMLLYVITLHASKLSVMLLLYSLI